MSDTASSENGAWFAVAEDWSVLIAEGADTPKFLQNFCTNDVAALADQTSCEAFFTDVKAHVIAYAVVARHGDAFYCVLSSSGAERLRDHLDRYLIAEKVDLAGAAETTVLLLGVGTDADATTLPLAGWPGGTRVAITAQDRLASIVETLRAKGAEPLTNESLEARRIRWGVPRDGVDVDERNLPQEVDRNAEAISFTKGCYLGQEPVARIDALGRVNWLLRGLSGSGPEPLPGAPLHTDGDKPVGRVTSVATTSDGWIALVYLRREHSTAGGEIAVGGATATVRALPLES